MEHWPGMGKLYCHPHNSFLSTAQLTVRACRQITTINDSRHLYRRAIADRSKYVRQTRGDYTELEERQYEYGNIHTSSAPSQATTPRSHRSPQDIRTFDRAGEFTHRNNDRRRDDGIDHRFGAAVQHKRTGAVEYRQHTEMPQDAPNPQSLETFDFDEGFWRTNDSLLGQHHLTSFLMGSELGMLGGLDFIGQ